MKKSERKWRGIFVGNTTRGKRISETGGKKEKLSG